MTIALVAIVKNERPIIERMFKSVEGLCDTWVIIDTGSTDGTYEWLQEHQKTNPGVLAQSEWKDFGTNRTELMRLAKGVADYLLFLDADMEIKSLLTVSESTPKLTEDVYLLEHIGDENNYWVERLVRGDIDWSFGGRTHEYLVREDGKPLVGRMYPSLKVIHHEDGSSRSEKYERDLRLLLEDWRDPKANKPRTANYLASTYSFLGDEKNQIKWLKKHIEIGDQGSEDVFYSQFHLARITNDPEAMLKAWLMRPSRAEPLAYLAQQYTIKGDFKRSYYFAKAALALPYPEDEISFISSAPYDYDILFNFSVAAFNLGKYDEAVQSGRELLGRNLPLSVRVVAEQNHAEFLEARDRDAH